jgi:GMP synthase-like glutamine amidotransferase
MSHTKLHIALLKTDTPMPELVDHLGDYHEQFDAVFDKAADIEHLNIHWDIFDVINMQEYPSYKDIGSRKYDAILLTGSDCSADGNDPWILKLVDFLKTVQTDHVGHVKLIGICFGHQVILRAAGGKTEENEAGWEVST